MDSIDVSKNSTVPVESNFVMDLIAAKAVYVYSGLLRARHGTHHSGYFYNERFRPDSQEPLQPNRPRQNEVLLH